MKPVNSEQIIINYREKEKINTFYNCINASNTLHYLEKEDIINLSKCSKSTNTFVNSNYFLIRNILQTSQTQ